MRTIALLKTAFAALALLAPAAVQAAQTPVDRADPSVIEAQFGDGRPVTDDAPPAPLAPRAPARAVAMSGTVLVGAIRIDGAAELPPARFAPVIAAYAGRSLSAEELRALASDVANAARRAGFGLATAWIPRQQVDNGLLRVMLDEGRVDAVEASGSGAGVARAMLAPLADGRAIRTAELERRLLLAGDVAGISVGKARLERRDGRAVLVVTAERNRVRARGSIDNWGSDPVGPSRTLASVDLNGLGFKDDQLSFGTVFTPVDPGEFGLVRAAYGKTLGPGGTQVGVAGYYARSEPGGVLADRGYEGRSIEANLTASHPVVRSRAVSLWADATLSLRDSDQWRRDLPIRSDRIASLAVSAIVSARAGPGRARGRIALTQGFDVLGATERGDPLASRDDADGVFTKLEVWGQFDRPLGGRFSGQLAATGQLASGPLLSSEEMGLGGRSFLRGYDYREFSGDRGIAGSAELRYDLGALPKPVRAAQLYVYGDAGTVGNDRGGGGGGSLASAGGGVRLWFGKTIEAGLELGVPLAKGYDRRADRDPRLSFSITSRF